MTSDRTWLVPHMRHQDIIARWMRARDWVGSWTGPELVMDPRAALVSERICIELLWALALEIDERMATRTGDQVCRACGGRGEVIVDLDHGAFIDPAFIARCRRSDRLHRVVESGTLPAEVRYGGPRSEGAHTRMVVDQCSCDGPTRPDIVQLHHVAEACASMSRPHFEWPEEWLVRLDQMLDAPDWIARWWLAFREWTHAGKLPDAEALAHDLAALLPELEAREQAKRDARPDIVCPTCENATPGACCSCNRRIEKSDQWLDSNPFADEIYGDDSPHLECGNCRHESAMDI